MTALVDAVVTVAPVPFVAIVTFPIACIGECFAHVAKSAGFHSLRGIVFTHQHMWWRCRFRERRHWPTISMSDEDVWVLVVGWIASFRCFSFITWPGSPAKAKPVHTSLCKSIATNADVILAVVASAAVVVQLVLDIVLTTAPACYLGLRVQDGCT